MAIGCDPELRLSLATGVVVDDAAANSTNSARLSRVDSLLRCSTPTRNLQQVTIFYNGRVCVCDATEIQARAIISLAKREMDDVITKKTSNEQQTQESMDESSALPASPRAMSPPEMLNPAGLSMKRSLQRFLQKRKARISDVSPYSCQKPKLLFPIKSQQS